MDKRLVEFCLALPPEQKRSQGWDRHILRRAMTDILPHEVQWRPGKADFSHNFVDGLLRYDRARLDHLLMRDDLCVSAYVDVDKVRSSYRQLTELQRDRDGQAINLWLVVVLEVWLRQSRVGVDWVWHRRVDQSHAG
jgi:asparagine synthase (glutamine-hydrolysing)